MIFSTIQHIFTHIYFSIVSIVISIYLLTLLFYNSSEKGMIYTFFCITGLLVTRWIYSGHLPLSDFYELVMFFSWVFSIIHMVPYFRNQKTHLSTTTVPSTILTQGFVTSDLLEEMPQSTILVPALQSQWLMMHVSMLVLSYAALLCGSLFTVALLVITFRTRVDIFSKKIIY